MTPVQSLPPDDGLASAVLDATFARMRPPRIADFRYDMRAGDLAAERVTIAQLQRRRALAVRRGDFRFARAYGLLVDYRIKEAQEER